jgi:hypothetical protein
MKIFRIGLVVSALAFAGVGVFNCGGGSDSGDSTGGKAGGGGGASGGSGGSDSGGGGKAGGGGSASGGSGGSASGGSGGSSGGSGGASGGSGGASGGSGGAGTGGKGGSGGAAGGAGGAGGGAGGAGGAAGAAAKFVADVAPILKEKCSGCHGNQYETAAMAYTRLTGTASMGPCANEKRMEPGNAANSLVVKKIKGTAGVCGVRMPLVSNAGCTGTACLTVDQIAKVESWINAGAMNN